MNCGGIYCLNISKYLYEQNITINHNTTKRLKININEMEAGFIILSLSI